MPKIKITEIDNTGLVQAQSISHAVYIPGPAMTNKDPWNNAFKFNSIKKLRTKLGYPRSTTDTEAKFDADMLNQPYGLSFGLAKHLLSLGMEVVYEALAADATIVPVESWKRLKDRGLYDVRFLTTGAYNCDPLAELDLNEANCAAARKDCIALYSSKSGLESVDKIRNYFFKQGEDKTGLNLKDLDEEVLKYVSIFAPTFKGRSEDFGEEEQDIPAAFGYLFAYARALKANPEWFAVAGSFRGMIPELVSPELEFTNADCEILQARSVSDEVELDANEDNVGNAINPIAFVRPFGYIIWGNRTACTNVANGDGTGLLKATTFLNVRNLVCTVNKALYNAARKYTFAQNNDLLWINFTSEINPLLDQMKSGNGIIGYKWTKLATTKKARLKARLTIIPIEAVEDFELEIELADSLEVVE